MSLINDVLKDLDARQASAGDLRPLPGAVRALPPRASRRSPWVAALAGVGLLAAGVAAYVFWSSLPGTESSAPPLAPPTAVARSAPIAVASPAPTPPATLPAAVEPPPPSPPSPQAPQPSQPSQPSQPPQASPVAPTQVQAPRVSPAAPRGGQSAPAGGKAAVATTPPASAAGKDSAPVRRRVAESVPPPAARTAVAAAPAVDKPPVDKPAKAPAIERSEATAPGERNDGDYRKAVNALNQGRVAEAVEALRNVLRSDPLQRSARQLLIKLLLEAQRLDEAIEVLHEGVQGQPAQIGWAMTLARLQLDRGNLSAAWKTLDESSPAAGNSADYQGFAGNVLQRLGRAHEAIARYQAAVRLAPADGRWWLGLGIALEADGNLAEAREAFARARQSGTLSPELNALVEQKLR